MKVAWASNESSATVATDPKYSAKRLVATPPQKPDNTLHKKSPRASRTKIRRTNTSSKFQGQYEPHRARRINSYSTPGPGAYDSSSYIGNAPAFSFEHAPKRQFSKQFYSREHQIKNLPGVQLTASVDFRTPGRWENQGAAATMTMPESTKVSAPSFCFGTDRSDRLDIARWRLVNHSFLVRDSDLNGTCALDHTTSKQIITSFGKNELASRSPKFSFGTGTRDAREQKQVFISDQKSD
jgi:hypothetical protein